MTRAGRLLAVAGLMALLAGCSTAVPQPSSRPSAALPSGTSEHTISVASGQRDYRVYRPESGPGAHGYPLVVMLHGGFGSAEQAEAGYGWDDLAAADGFVVAYPDGQDRAWDAGSCCGRPSRQHVDDVGFITAVVAQLQGLVTVDPARVYATGMSNGAMMTYRLACETTIFAAVAPVAGDQMVDCVGAAPVSLLNIHGTADTNVPLAGGPGQGTAKVDGPPIADVVDGWRHTDGCGAFATTTKPPVTTRTAACPDGRSVELVLVAGAGHQWPGSKKTGNPGADPPSDAFDATALIWDFFRHHPKS